MAVHKWDNAVRFLEAALASKEYNETSDDLTSEQQAAYFCDAVTHTVLDGECVPYMDLWSELNTSMAYVAPYGKQYTYIPRNY